MTLMMTDALTADGDTSNGAVIVALPAATDPAAELNDGEAHCTLAYLGNASLITPPVAKALEKVLADVAAMCAPFEADISGSATLGPAEALVLLLESDELVELREALESVPLIAMILDAYEKYPSTIYHMTAGYGADTKVPDLEEISFNALGLWIGEKRLTFPLKALDTIAESMLADQGEDLLELTAAGKKTFDPSLHPRGADGRFITKFGIIKFLKDGSWAYGKVEGINKSDTGAGVDITITPSDLSGKPNGSQSVVLKPSQIYSAPKKMASLSIADSTKAKKVGGQGGSNEGGTYEIEAKPDTNGVAWEPEKYYVKKAKTSTHGKNEELANRLYAEAGVPVPAVTYNKAENQIFSKIIDGQHDMAQQLGNQEWLSAVRKNFAVDAWLANRDVFGMTYDNMLTDAHGTPWRIDNGGALLYRAMGEKKTDFGSKVTELDVFRTGKKAKIFGANMTKDEELDGAQRVLAISPGEIEDMVSEAGLPQSLADTLKARRLYIADYYGLPLPESMKPADTNQVATSAPLVDAADLAQANGKKSRDWFPTNLAVAAFLLEKGDKLHNAETNEEVTIGLDQDGKLLSTVGKANQLIELQAKWGATASVNLKKPDNTPVRPDDGMTLPTSQLAFWDWQRGDKLVDTDTGAKFAVLGINKHTGAMLVKKVGSELDPDGPPFLLDTYSPNVKPKTFDVERWDPPAIVEEEPAPVAVELPKAPTGMATEATEKIKADLDEPLPNGIGAAPEPSVTTAVSGEKSMILGDGTEAKPGATVVSKFGGEYKFVKPKGPYAVVTDPNGEDPEKLLTKKANTLLQPGKEKAAVPGALEKPTSANGKIPAVGQQAKAKDGHEGTITQVSPDGKFVFILNAAGVKKRKSIGTVTILDGDAPNAAPDEPVEVADIPDLEDAKILPPPSVDIPATPTIEDGELVTPAQAIAAGLKPGDSVSINGTTWYPVIKVDSGYIVGDAGDGKTAMLLVESSLKLSVKTAPQPIQTPTPEAPSTPEATAGEVPVVEEIVAPAVKVLNLKTTAFLQLKPGDDVNGDYTVVGYPVQDGYGDAMVAVVDPTDGYVFAIYQSSMFGDAKTVTSNPGWTPPGDLDTAKVSEIYKDAWYANAFASGNLQSVNGNASISYTAIQQGLDPTQEGLLLAFDPSDETFWDLSQPVATKWSPDISNWETVPGMGGASKPAVLDNTVQVDKIAPVLPDEPVSELTQPSDTDTDGVKVVFNGYTANSGDQVLEMQSTNPGAHPDAQKPSYWVKPNGEGDQWVAVIDGKLSGGAYTLALSDSEIDWMESQGNHKITKHNVGEEAAQSTPAIPDLSDVPESQDVPEAAVPDVAPAPEAAATPVKHPSAINTALLDELPAGYTLKPGKAVRIASYGSTGGGTTYWEAISDKQAFWRQISPDGTINMVKKVSTSNLPGWQSTLAFDGNLNALNDAKNGNITPGGFPNSVVSHVPAEFSKLPEGVQSWLQEHPGAALTKATSNFGTSSGKSRYFAIDEDGKVWMTSWTAPEAEATLTKPYTDISSTKLYAMFSQDMKAGKLGSFEDITPNGVPPKAEPEQPSFHGFTPEEGDLVLSSEELVGSNAGKIHYHVKKKDGDGSWYPLNEDGTLDTNFAEAQDDETIQWAIDEQGSQMVFGEMPTAHDPVKPSPGVPAASTVDKPLASADILGATARGKPLNSAVKSLLNGLGKVPAGQSLHVKFMDDDYMHSLVYAVSNTGEVKLWTSNGTWIPTATTVDMLTPIDWPAPSAPGIKPNGLSITGWSQHSELPSPSSLVEGAEGSAITVPSGGGWVLITSTSDPGVGYWAEIPAGNYVMGTDQFTPEKFRLVTNGETAPDVATWMGGPVSLVSHYSKAFFPPAWSGQPEAPKVVPVPDWVPAQLAGFETYKDNDGDLWVKAGDDSWVMASYNGMFHDYKFNSDGTLTPEWVAAGSTFGHIQSYGLAEHYEPGVAPAAAATPDAPSAPAVPDWVPQEVADKHVIQDSDGDLWVPNPENPDKWVIWQTKSGNYGGAWSQDGKGTWYGDSSYGSSKSAVSDYGIAQEWDPADAPGASAPAAAPAEPPSWVKPHLAQHKGIHLVEKSDAYVWYENPEAPGHYVLSGYFNPDGTLMPGAPEGWTLEAAQANYPDNTIEHWDPTGGASAPVAAPAQAPDWVPALHADKKVYKDKSGDLWIVADPANPDHVWLNVSWNFDADGTPSDPGGWVAFAGNVEDTWGPFETWDPTAPAPSVSVPNGNSGPYSTPAPVPTPPAAAPLWPGEKKPTPEAIASWGGDLTKDGHIPTIGMYVKRASMSGAKIISISSDKKTVKVLLQNGKTSQRYINLLSVDSTANYTNYAIKPVAPVDIPAGMPLAVDTPKEALANTLKDGKWRPILSGTPGVRGGEIIVTRSGTPSGKKVARVQLSLTKDQRAKLIQMLESGGGGEIPVEKGDWDNAIKKSDQVALGDNIPMRKSSTNNPDGTPRWKVDPTIKPPTHVVTEIKDDPEAGVKLVTMKDLTTGELITSRFHPGKDLQVYTWNPDKPKPPPAPTSGGSLKLSAANAANGWKVLSTSDGVISKIEGGTVDGKLSVEPGQAVPSNQGAIPWQKGGVRRVTSNGVVIEVLGLTETDVDSANGATVITVPEGLDEGALGEALEALGIGYTPMTQDTAKVAARGMLRNLLSLDMKDSDTAKGWTDDKLFTTAGNLFGINDLGWQDVLVGTDESTGKLSYFWSPRVQSAIASKTKFGVLVRAASSTTPDTVISQLLYGAANGILKRTAGMQGGGGVSASSDASNNAAHGSYASMLGKGSALPDHNPLFNKSTGMMIYMNPMSVLSRIQDWRTGPANGDMFGAGPGNGGNSLAGALSQTKSQDFWLGSGIPGEAVSYIGVKSATVRAQTIAKLHQQGITHMYGRPIEDIIRNMYDVAGTKPGDLPPPYIPANVRPILDLPTSYDAPTAEGAAA